mgnify:CR=1 FL=1|tara:strand:- start:130 stop:312 length:183 start_codon:yes stop_codon:yes gene_type:complete
MEDVEMMNEPVEITMEEVDAPPPNAPQRRKESGVSQQLIKGTEAQFKSRYFNSNGGQGTF